MDNERIFAPSGHDHDGDSPAERFRRFGKALFAVPRAELEEALANEQRLTTSGTLKRKPGPRPGTPNWRTKRKESGVPVGQSSNTV